MKSASNTAQRLQMMKNQMEIRQRREVASNPAYLRELLMNPGALSQEEQMVLDSVTMRWKQDLAAEGVSTDEAKQLIQSVIEPFGEKQFVRFLIEPVLIMGVPYTWFVVNAFANMFLFAGIHNFQVLLIASPAIHLISYVCYRKNAARLRKEKIQKLMKEGI